MNARIAILAVAAGLAAAGCGDKCNDESPDVTDVPAACAVPPASTVTYTVDVCARCNQATPRCDVIPQYAQGYIQLDLLAEACEAGNSCPVPSCDLGGSDRRAVACTIPVPAVASGTEYQIFVYDESTRTNYVVPQTDGLPTVTVTDAGTTTCGAG